MEIRDAMDGLAGYGLLALPWLLLAASAWRAGQHPAPAAARGARTAVPHSPRPEQLVADVVPDAQPTPPMAMLGQPATAPSRSAEAFESEAVRLAGTLQAAEDGGDPAVVTRDGLALARLLLARGERPQGEALLRKTVMVATRAKLPEAHAEARIELAELAGADGDMTTACEHWQMAKLMYHDLDRKEDRDRMADLMRQNRCPTDWFLTGF